LATGLALIVYMTDRKKEKIKFEIVKASENSIISQYIKKQNIQSKNKMQILNSQIIKLPTVSINLTQVDTCQSTMLLADEILKKEPHSITSSNPFLFTSEQMTAGQG